MQDEYWAGGFIAACILFALIKLAEWSDELGKREEVSILFTLI